MLPSIIDHLTHINWVILVLLNNDISIEYKFSTLAKEEICYQGFDKKETKRLIYICYYTKYNCCVYKHMTTMKVSPPMWGFKISSKNRLYVALEYLLFNM